jgi:hypothetical protein
MTIDLTSLGRDHAGANRAVLARGRRFNRRPL